MLNEQEQQIYNMLSRNRVGALGRAEQLRTKVPKTNEKKGNFLTDFIPTATSILGGIGGTLVAPGVGTAAGGVAGGIAGTKLRNMLTGEEDKAEDYLTEGAFGAFGGIGKAGRAIGGAAKALKSGEGAGRAASILRSGAPQGQVARSVASEPEVIAEPLKSSFRGKLVDYGNRALASQYGTIGKNVARGTDPIKTIGTLADYGLVKPTDVERISGAVTGSGGIVNKAVLDAVGGAGRVNTDGLLQIADDAMQNAGIVDTNAKSILSTVKAQVKKLQGGPNPKIGGSADPNDALAVMKALESRAADLRGMGGNYRLATPERVDQAKVLQLVRDEIEDRLYGVAGADKNLPKVLTPQLRESLASLKPGDARWQQFVDDNVMGAKSISDLRSSMAPFVRARKIIDEGDTNSMTFGGRAGNAIVQGGPGNTAMAILANTLKNPAARAAGTTLRNVSGAVPGATNPLATGAKIAATQVPARMLGGGFPGSGQEAQAMGEPPANNTTMTDGTDLGGIDQEALAAITGATQQTPTSQYPLENAMQDIQKDLSTTGGQNLDTIMKVFEFANPKEAGKDKLSANQQKTSMQMANAETALDTLMRQYESAGGGQGPIMGALSSFLGGVGFNDPLRTYEQQLPGSVTQIARAMGEVGQMTDADRAAYISSLPKATDTAEVARMKLANIQQMLAAAKRNAVANPDAFSSGDASDVLGSLEY